MTEIPVYAFDTEGRRTTTELALVNARGECVWSHDGPLTYSHFRSLTPFFGGIFVGCDPKSDWKRMRRAAKKCRFKIPPVQTVNIQVIDAHIHPTRSRDYMFKRNLRSLCKRYKINHSPGQGQGWHSAHGDAIRTMLVFQAQVRILGFNRAVSCKQSSLPLPSPQVANRLRQLVRSWTRKFQALMTGTPSGPQYPKIR